MNIIIIIPYNDYILFPLALVTSTCSQFQGGIALHIAAANLCLASAKIVVSIAH